MEGKIAKERLKELMAGDMETPRANSVAGCLRRPSSFAVKAKLLRPSPSENRQAIPWRNKGTQTVHVTAVNGSVEALTERGLLLKKHRGRKRQAPALLQGYIGKCVEMLDYPRFLADGFQIGSGPTEAQCKCLTSRLKGRGRRWNRPRH
jgi:hypothetical protein